MSTLEDWQDKNEKYLEAAVKWVRLKLEMCSQTVGSTGGALVAVMDPPHVEAVLAPSVAPSLPTHRQWRWFWRPPAPTQAAPIPLLDAPTSQSPAYWVTDEQIAEAGADMDHAASGDNPPALVNLARLLGLSDFERSVLLLCCAMELDTRIASLCGRAQDDPNRPYPTFALAMAIFEDAGWEALSPERPLRYWRLLEIHQPGAQPLTASALRADERIVNAVKGLNYLDDRLMHLLVPAGMPGMHDPPPSQQAVVDEIIRTWSRSGSASIRQIIQLLGMDPHSKRAVAVQAARNIGRQLFIIPVDRLPVQVGELETLSRLWMRESALLPIALYIDAQDLKPSSDGADGKTSALNTFLNSADGFVFLAVREIWERAGRSDGALEVRKPTPLEQQQAWADALGERAGGSPAALSGQFDLDHVSIIEIADASMQLTTDDAELQRLLWSACRERARPRMDSLAQRIEAKATWNDLVLPAEQMALLRQIADQVGQRSRVYQEWGFAERSDRGLGINALFAGDSGTGKTMAAEVIANELRLNLYRIDLSAVVSKYIGETEKNLRALFDAAEDGSAILFFDEADALFGKRSEVKDSHDRYANIEINYLLQRMEAFRGLAILATNMRSSLDTAFMRRLRFVVNFPNPGVAERRLIWQKVFPANAPVEELDYDRLTRLALTGGNINNVAMNAAFMAAHEGSHVSMEHILKSARTEFVKLERPINESDFRWTAPVEAAA